ASRRSAGRVRGDTAPRALRQAVRDRKIRGNKADRVDHDKQSDQSGDEKFERHACRSRYSFAAILARQKGTAMEPRSRIQHSEITHKIRLYRMAFRLAKDT